MVTTMYKQPLTRAERTQNACLLPKTKPKTALPLLLDRRRRRVGVVHFYCYRSGGVPARHFSVRLRGCLGVGARGEPETPRLPKSEAATAHDEHPAANIFSFFLRLQHVGAQNRAIANSAFLANTL